MTGGAAASRRVLGCWTPVAPLPASSPTRPTGINGRTSPPPDSSLPEVCSFQLPKVCSFRLPLTGGPQRRIDTAHARAYTSFSILRRTYPTLERIEQRITRGSRPVSARL